MEAFPVTIVDKLQPQCAALLAASARGRAHVPAPGCGMLSIAAGEVVPALRDRVADVLAQTGARGSTEWNGLTLEVIVNDPEQLPSVREALESIEIVESTEAAGVAATGAELHESIDIAVADAANRTRGCVLLLAGDNLLSVNPERPEQAIVLANRIEAHHPGCDLVSIDGRIGRIVFRGTTRALGKIQMSLTP